MSNCYCCYCCLVQHHHEELCADHTSTRRWLASPQFPWITNAEPLGPPNVGVEAAGAEIGLSSKLLPRCRPAWGMAMAQAIPSTVARARTLRSGLNWVAPDAPLCATRPSTDGDSAGESAQQVATCVDVRKGVVETLAR